MDRRVSPDKSDNLALYRPMTASSVGHFPTPAEFAVDGQSDTGWRSTRKQIDEADWLTVDLQAQCQINAVGIIWASTADKGVFLDVRTSSLFRDEQVSGYGAVYSVSISNDGKDWKKVHSETQGTGGTDKIDLPPTQGRFVRVTIEKRSHPKVGVGINELAVIGTCKSKRPEVDSWVLRRKPKTKPILAKADPKSTEMLLDTGWELMRTDWADLTAEKVISPALDTSDWYNATVPGTILTTLVDQGVFDEPTIGTNNLKIPESLCRHDWWYRTELQVPKQWITKNQRLWLEFDAINHDAEIWLNKECLGTIKGGFMRGRFDVTDKVSTTGNILAVRIIPPAHPGIPMEKNETDWLYNGGALGKDSPTFLASIGWDWIAPVRDRGMGIWSPVRLRRTGIIKIEDSQIVTDLPLPQTDSADITISVPVRNQSDQMQKVTVQASFDKTEVSQLIVVPAGGVGTAKFTPKTHSQLTVKNPKLWWPVGYGDPHLYDLQLSAEVDGVISDTQATRFGIRELSYRGRLLNTGKKEEKERDTISFSPVQVRFVRLNCIERATKYGFSLYTLSVFNSQTPDRDLAQGADVKASTIESNEHPAAHAVDGNPDTRWASERFEPQTLTVDLGKPQTIDSVRIKWEVAYAKRFAIQVSEDGRTWTDVKDLDASNEPQDLEISVNGQRILCRGGNWGYPEMLMRLSDERQETSIRLHRQANMNMIRNWIGMSTNEAFYDLCDEYGILIWNDFWLANPGDGPNPDNSELFMSNVKDTILRYRNHPSIAIWCGRNEGMPPKDLDQGMRQLTGELDGTRFYQSHSSDVGVNGGGPYKYMPPERYFDDLNRGFKTELGMPSVPSAESMRKMLADSNPWPIDIRWAYHDFCPRGNQYRDEYIKAINENFGAADSLDGFCKKAQMINYEGYRAIFEGANHKIWNDCSGILLWMSHPTWPSTVWQVYDYWYGTDGAYFGSQKANEPIHIQLCRLDNTVEMINHTANPVAGTVKAQVLSLNAKVLWEKTEKLTAGADCKTDGFKLELPAQLPPAYFVHLAWTDQKGGLMSENMYWLSSEKGGLKALNRMPGVKLKGKVTQKDNCQMTVQLVNNTKNIAFMTRLVLRDADTGERILPTYYSDNYMSLLPGQSKQVTMTCTEKDADKRKKVSIDGWNIKTAEIK